MSTVEVETVVSLLDALDLTQDGDSVVGNVEEALLEAVGALIRRPDLREIRSRLINVHSALDSWRRGLEESRLANERMSIIRRQRSLALQSLADMVKAAKQIADSFGTASGASISTTAPASSIAKLEQELRTLVNLFHETRSQGQNGASVPAPVWANPDAVVAQSSTSAAIVRREPGAEGSSNSQDDASIPPAPRRSTPYSFSQSSTPRNETRSSSRANTSNAIPNRHFKKMHITGAADAISGRTFENAAQAAADTSVMVFDEIVIDGNARVVAGDVVGASPFVARVVPYSPQ